MSRHRRWTYTWNNFTCTAGENWFPNATFHIYSHEKGLLEETPHLQGYLELKNGMTMSALLKKHPGCYFAVSNGNAKSNIDYVSKKDATWVGGPWTWGEPKAQGARTDLLEVQEQIADGATAEEIADESFPLWCRNHRAIDRYIAMKAPKRDWKTEVWIIWGTTGTGKTKMVYEKEENLFFKPDGEWYDGYTGQEAVLFDDFMCDIKLTQMLRLLDRYPMQVPVKGDFVNWAPRRLYITSNLDPALWYSGCAQESIKALMRRIEFIIKLD